jgi:hypothetical protein
MKKTINNSVVFLIAMVALSQFSNAQYFQVLSLKPEINASVNQVGSGFHSDIRPYYADEIISTQKDSVFTFAIDSTIKRYVIFKDENLWQWQTKKSKVVVKPLVNIRWGFESQEQQFCNENNLGFSAAYSNKNKIAAGFSFYGSQSVFPNYINKKIFESDVIPSGQGRALRSDLGGFYSLNYQGYVNYHFLKYFTLEAGFGKNFWGDGYRSLFLSDQTYNYPYVKIVSNFWHIKLINLYANFKNYPDHHSATWSNLPDKYGAFHYLSWDISKRVTFGFFESVIWEKKDSLGNRGFDVAYLNPVVFLRPVEFSRGSPDNSMLGISLKVKVGKKTSLYGQLLLDDIVFNEAWKGTLNRIKKWFGNKDSTLTYGFWSNKEAWQIGVKSYDCFGAKNLFCLLEFNFVRPYTYAHRRVIQNYSHYNEPLAHPAGANLWEISALVNYSLKRWRFEFHANYIQSGMDDVNTNSGQNIFKPVWDVVEPGVNNVVVNHYQNNIGQGIKTQIHYYSIISEYRIFKSTEMYAGLGYVYKFRKTGINNATTNYIFVSIKMGLDKPHIDY